MLVLNFHKKQQLFAHISQLLARENIKRHNQINTLFKRNSFLNRTTNMQ